MQGVHVRVLVNNFPDCFRFYSEALGLKVTWGDAEDVYASFQTSDGALLSIFKRDLMAEAVGRKDYPAQVRSQDNFVLTFGVEDLNGIYDKLCSLGVPVVTAPVDRPGWGIRVAHFRDPDGNLIELNMELPRDKWTLSLQQDADRYNW